MCEYGFQEGVDFCSFLSESTGGRPATDYQITIDMAKEICMIQRSEKGKQARQYFLKLEREWNSPEKVMARALKMADEKIAKLTLENEAMKPKALFADAVETSKDSILVGHLAKLIRQNGYPIGQNRLFQWLRDEGYLCSRGTNYNLPTQRSMEMGLMEIRERTINNPDGSVRTTRTTMITGRGQIYFVNKFLTELSGQMQSYTMPEQMQAHTIPLNKV